MSTRKQVAAAENSAGGEATEGTNSSEGGNGSSESSYPSSEHASATEWGVVFALLGPGANDSSDFYYNSSGTEQTPALFNSSSATYLPSSSWNSSTVGRGQTEKRERTRVIVRCWNKLFTGR